MAYPLTHTVVSTVNVLKIVRYFCQSHSRPKLSQDFCFQQM